MSEQTKCVGCGGPHLFDTSVPSPVWNKVIRDGGLPEYLCAACILSAFVLAKVSFTAQLWGEGFDGVPIEVRINSQAAQDAAALTEENNELRHAATNRELVSNSSRTDAYSPPNVASVGDLVRLRVQIEQLPYYTAHSEAPVDFWGCGMVRLSDVLALLTIEPKGVNDDELQILREHRHEAARSADAVPLQGQEAQPVPKAIGPSGDLVRRLQESATRIVTQPGMEHACHEFQILLREATDALRSRQETNAVTNTSPDSQQAAPTQALTADISTDISTDKSSRRSRQEPT